MLQNDSIGDSCTIQEVEHLLEWRRVRHVPTHAPPPHCLNSAVNLVLAQPIAAKCTYIERTAIRAKVE